MERGPEGDLALPRFDSAFREAQHRGAVQADDFGPDVVHHPATSDRDYEYGSVWWHRQDEHRRSAAGPVLSGR